MSAQEQAEKLIQELLDRYNSMKATRGTWYLWEFKNKRAEVTDLLAKGITNGQ